VIKLLFYLLPFLRRHFRKRDGKIISYYRYPIAENPVQQETREVGDEIKYCQWQQGDQIEASINQVIHNAELNSEEIQMPCLSAVDPVF
jgi:hypothetical protein